jgi:hypothetical protein
VMSRGPARGVTQFLDIESGIPSVGNVHEVAPDARVTQWAARAGGAG